MAHRSAIGPGVFVEVERVSLQPNTAAAHHLIDLGGSRYTVHPVESREDEPTLLTPVTEERRVAVEVAVFVFEAHLVGGLDDGGIVLVRVHHQRVERFAGLLLLERSPFLQVEDQRPTIVTRDVKAGPVLQVGADGAVVPVEGVVRVEVDGRRLELHGKSFPRMWRILPTFIL